MNPIKSEPALTVGAIMGIVYILAAFGLPISEEQQTALRDNLPVVLPGIAVMVGIIRQLVFAPDTVAELEAESFAEGMRATRR